MDHRVVPWEPANSNIVSASVIRSGEDPAFRDVRQDFVVRPGHTVAVTASKKQTLRTGGGRIWGQGGCRSYTEDKVCLLGQSGTIRNRTISDHSGPFDPDHSGLFKNIQDHSGSFQIILDYA